MLNHDAVSSLGGSLLEIPRSASSLPLPSGSAAAQIFASSKFFVAEMDSARPTQWGIVRWCVIDPKPLFLRDSLVAFKLFHDRPETLLAIPPGTDRKENVFRLVTVTIDDYSGFACLLQPESRKLVEAVAHRDVVISGRDQQRCAIAPLSQVFQNN